MNTTWQSTRRRAASFIPAARLQGEHWKHRDFDTPLMGICRVSHLDRICVAHRSPSRLFMAWRCDPDERKRCTSHQLVVGSWGIPQAKPFLAPTLAVDTFLFDATDRLGYAAAVNRLPAVVRAQPEACLNCLSPERQKLVINSPKRKMDRRLGRCNAHVCPAAPSTSRCVDANPRWAIAM